MPSFSSLQSAVADIEYACRLSEGLDYKTAAKKYFHSPHYRKAWNIVNARRHELIEKKSRGRATPGELDVLEELQELTGRYLRCITCQPVSIRAELDGLADHLVREGKMTAAEAEEFKKMRELPPS